MNETGVWTGILNRKKVGTFKFIYVKILESSLNNETESPTNNNNSTASNESESRIVQTIDNNSIRTSSPKNSSSKSSPNKSSPNSPSQLNVFYLWHFSILLILIN